MYSALNPTARAEVPGRLRGGLCSSQFDYAGGAKDLKTSDVRDPYVRRLAEHFHNLAVAGRGDNARGRSLHVLHFLEFAWSRRDLPLNSYRPSRRPGAFLAMVFDLLGDASRGYTDLLLEGHRAAVLQDVGRRLKAPWHGFVGEVEASGFPRLAAVLDETLQAALRNPAQSGLPGFLRHLRLYMTPSQLALLDVRLLIGRLSVGEVLAYLRFEPPTATEVEERHPVGGDLRKVIRASYDAPWRRALEAVGELDLVTFFAVFPVDLTAIALGRSLGADLDDFAVFYACVTDAKAPGRVWQAPDAYVGADEEARRHFAFLCARGARESLSRRAQGLLRLGLSGTFPETFRHLDGWLGSPERFPELHAGRPWREAVAARKNRVAEARLRFLEGLARTLEEAV